jgi:hypothetical protein
MNENDAVLGTVTSGGGVSEGYLLLAVGQQKYADMAINCAASIKLFEDGGRPIQLVIDRSIHVDEALRRHVDFLDTIEMSHDLPATLNKLRLWELTRFERTLFVDADCLLLKRGMDRHWAKLNKFDFAIPGHESTSGEWYRTDISELLKLSGIAYIVQMNSGVIFFKKTLTASNMFVEAKKMLKDYGHYVKQRHGTGEHGDEVFLGLAFGSLGLKPYPFFDSEAGSLMYSTLNGSEFHFGLTGDASRFKKGNHVVSPHFVHFVGLEPRREYERLARALR